MSTKIEKFCREFALKSFYTIADAGLDKREDKDRIKTFEALEDFIRQFHSKFVNFYGLSKQKALKQTKYENRLSEFYSEFCEKILDHDLDSAVIWLLDQEIEENLKLFPNRPIADNYQDIMRSLSVLIELFKSIPVSGPDAYQKVFNHVKNILSPALDEEFEQLGRDLLDQLKDFNARKDGIESPKFNALTIQIKKTNEQIRHLLMSNNTFVSILQQITEINKALKTVRKDDFKSILDAGDLQLFWDGLKESGYSGGDNYLYGDFAKLKKELLLWIQDTFPSTSEVLTAILQNTHQLPELPSLDKEIVPEAVHLYSIKLLGETGLRTKESINLILGYHTRFVDKMVRDGAFQALRKNSDQVQDFFFKALGKADDYDQMLQIVDKHDSIFEHIQAEKLVKTFGESFRDSLRKLDTTTQPDGILLGNFIRSAYMKPPGNKLEKAAKPNSEEFLNHFHFINNKLDDFKQFINTKTKDGFVSLIRMWGLNYIVSWALTNFIGEDRLFTFIIKAATESPVTRVTTIDRVIPMQDIVTLLSKEPDAKELIQKLMTFLLNSKISFDYRLFSSLFQVVAQRQLQLRNGITIRDGFSEQRGYTQSLESTPVSSQESDLQDPHIFHPIVVFLITVLHMKFINIPKDAFVETDISLYLNSLAGHQKTPELGYQMYLAHQLISCIPYIKDFSSQHETIIRKTIADLDEFYKRKNVLFHYHRIKIHRAPSKLDLDFCMEILEGLSTKNPDEVLFNLKRLMKGIGDEAIPDMEEYFSHYRSKIETLGRHLSAFKKCYQNEDWCTIAENQEFTKTVRDLPGIDADSVNDIIGLVKLAFALSNYWTQRINNSFIQEYLSDDEQEVFAKATTQQRLDITRDRREKFENLINRYDQNLEPYQHIFLKRHVIQGDWNFDFFGFWPYYKETKFEAYNTDRKLAELERMLLEDYVEQLSGNRPQIDHISNDSLLHLRALMDCLQRIMVHLVSEGLSPSKYFLDTIDVLGKDQLTISQLHDILGILYHRELSHIDSFIANTFGHFPAQITKALGRENLDFGLEKLTVSNEELLYPLVQETVLGNIIGGIQAIHLLEDHLGKMIRFTSQLKKKDPSKLIFNSDERPPNRLSPVYYGYKSYALQTLAQDGFNVPALVTIPVNYYSDHPEFISNNCHTDYKTHLIRQILELENKTKKKFDFNFSKLNDEQQKIIETSRKDFPETGHAPAQLFLSARSGSYRSMPGILGTVLNIGYKDVLNPNFHFQNKRLDLNTYRMFISTFGNVVFGINETSFSKIVDESKQEIENKFTRKIKWEDLSDDQIINIINGFKHLVESRNKELPEEKQVNIDWNDPLELLAISTLGIWNSWNSSAAERLRNFLDISPDWKTPVTLMEMKQADKNSRSFSAILFSGDPQGKIDKPHGDLLFGRPGEDIASGLASGGEHLENLETKEPGLYAQIAELLEQIKINKGYINVDVEMVGEFDPETEHMELFVVQERQMPLGTRGESEDYRLTPTDIAPVATGKGVNGGVQHGVLLDGISQEYYELRDTVKDVRNKLGLKNEFHGPGIFLLMKYVTPEEALKMNIEGVDGVITSKIGKSSHASIAAKRDGKMFVCEASVTLKDNDWFIGDRKINLGNSNHPDLFTIIGNPKSVSPYSGNIYEGCLPLTRVLKKR